ncbi:M56 family metallopeptidase [Thermoleophilum album]|uniref:Signal transducer regulating beta-lactamase production, contains metallopeptidase domain n=1 Tax=Thermoleophilum album TaxID=29539 RepID=A0A1H6G1W5_THEAL|nr:M56 family metallopeptidase [Thermoleophilum album]SEH16273.1 Signal transducer regulating beta-lactamase production, contains metallopeptidase domain [Thermoleophilum album]
MTVQLAAAAVLAGALSLPHILPLRIVAPTTAATIWFAALALRALTAIGLAAFVLLYVPQTGAFRAVAERCWHAILPLLTDHLGPSAHPLADAAVILPAMVLATSAVWVACGLIRAAVAVDLHIRRRARARGPLGSTVVEDNDVVVAVAGIGRGRIVVSDTALGVLDAEELEASVTHELGHIKRRHRPLLVLGSLLAAIGRWLPGTAAAERELAFSLERDADEFAVSRTANPLALASAICKAAQARGASAIVPALGGRGPVGQRLDDLLAGGRRRGGRGLERAARALALLMLVLVGLVAVTMPSWALAAPSKQSVDATLTSCHDHA